MPRYDLQKREIVMEEAAARRAAEALLREHKTGTPFKTFDASAGLTSMPDAYDIQDKYVALLRSEQGEPVGYKVGLTSKTMQTFCGIDHPIGGVVLAKRVLQSGATVRRGDYGRLGLEFEVAVRIKSDIPATAQTPAAIAPHVDGVCAAIEVVDDRAADYGKLDVKSLVADNSWNAGMVLSNFAASWPDLEGMLGKATGDGAPIGEGYGRDILGHPFNSVAWLNAQLASRGGGLRKGQVVMTGSVMKTVFPTEAASYRFEFAGLGAVEVRVA
jgi:2-keto-4-pentenoate hydratase